MLILVDLRLKGIQNEVPFKFKWHWNLSFLINLFIHTSQVQVQIQIPIYSQTWAQGQVHTVRVRANRWEFYFVKSV